jgi:hypothetical protein
MYLRPEVVRLALSELRSLHPFFGITYLVCKKAGLPVGNTVPFPINAAEEEFLETYYKPDPTSKYFFQPFRTSSRAGRWLSPKYASSGSQSTRTRGHLAKAFIHVRKTNQWGWDVGYVKVLREQLDRDKLVGIPTFSLAAWLYRHVDWQSSLSLVDLQNRLFSDFYLSADERDQLFSAQAPDLGDLLIDEPFSDRALLESLEPAPDSPPEEGGTLRLLEMRGIGPSPHLVFNPAERLSIITGDNGLGKTFILECAWWALTGRWAERPAYPNPDELPGTPSLRFGIAAGETRSTSKTIPYDWQTQQWVAPKGRPTVPGLVVYARVDGSFAVWDPARHLGRQVQGAPALVFSRDEVLGGLEGQIEGLLRDWVRWQNSQDQRAVFETFCTVLRKLSPPDMSPLTPGPSIRLPGEARAVPTLSHPYGNVPIVNESAGVRRIITLAYLLVWSWNEHKIYSTLSKRSPQRQLVILMDEVEAHLHPKWQRVVLPALLDVATVLSRELRYQAIIATHSPLILASLETRFSDHTDKLFHLRLTEYGHAQFDELRFVKYGPIDKWLTSPIFELPQARSREGEAALEQAKSLLSATRPDVESIRSVSAALLRTLPQDDPFWPRWVYFAESKGVKL